MSSVTSANSVKQQLRSRLREAVWLYDCGYSEGSLVLAIVAAEGVAKLRFPEERDSTVRLRTLLHELLGAIMHGPSANVDLPFKSNQTKNVVDILIGFVRNSLIHEGALSRDLELLEPHHEGGNEYSRWRMGHPLGVPVQLSMSIVSALRTTDELR